MITFQELKEKALKKEPVAWLIQHENQQGVMEPCVLIGRIKDIRDMCDFGEPIALYMSMEKDDDSTR